MASQSARRAERALWPPAELFECWPERPPDVGGDYARALFIGMNAVVLVQTPNARHTIQEKGNERRPFCSGDHLKALAKTTRINRAQVGRRFHLDEKQLRRGLYAFRVPENGRQVGSRGVDIETTKPVVRPGLDDDGRRGFAKQPFHPAPRPGRRLPAQARVDDVDVVT